MGRDEELKMQIMDQLRGGSITTNERGRHGQEHS